MNDDFCAWLGIAWHESAHAVLGVILGLRVRRVLIFDDGSGYVAFDQTNDPDAVLVALAGIAAERSRGLPPDETKCAFDREDARRFLRGRVPDPHAAVERIERELELLFRRRPALRELIEGVGLELIAEDRGGWLSGDFIREKVYAKPADWLQDIREQCRAILARSGE